METQLPFAGLEIHNTLSTLLSSNAESILVEVPQNESITLPCGREGVEVLIPSSTKDEGIKSSG
jgi:hypothetical protein